MTLFTHVVTLEPVPRRWFDQCVAMLHETVESLRPEDDGLATEDGRTVSAVRLVEGRERGDHRVEPQDHDRRSGRDRRRRDVHRLGRDAAVQPVDAAGVMVIKQYKRLSSLSWSGEAELDRWWAGGPAAAPITASAKHMFAVARATVLRRPATDGRWEVEVAVKLRGRSVFRPFVTLAMLFAKSTVQKSINEAIETYAANCAPC